MQNWAISLDRSTVENFSHQNHTLLTVDGLLADPETAISNATLQKFAKITPQYPGIRAPLASDVIADWLEQLAPMLEQHFGGSPKGWEMQAWYSIVTTPPEQLIPMQCFPHVDGTDPRQLAMMLYLHETDHGGTGFFRHRTTGFEELSEETYPRYAAVLQDDVRKTGLPPARYVTDGAPHFERIHASSGKFNQAIFYRGNLLHSGIIDNEADLPTDPRSGRLTINAFFRPL